MHAPHMILEILLFLFPFLSHLTAQDGHEKDKRQERRLEKHRLGVWEIVILAESSFVKRLFTLQLPTRESIDKSLNVYFQYGPYLIQFFTEIYQVAPKYLITYGIKNLWNSLESGLSLYYTSRLLEVVSTCIELVDLIAR